MSYDSYCSLSKIPISFRQECVFAILKLDIDIMSYWNEIIMPVIYGRYDDSNEIVIDDNDSRNNSALKIIKHAFGEDITLKEFIENTHQPIAYKFCLIDLKVWEHITKPNSYSDYDIKLNTEENAKKRYMQLASYFINSKYCVNNYVEDRFDTLKEFTNFHELLLHTLKIQEAVAFNFDSVKEEMIKIYNMYKVLRCTAIRVEEYKSGSPQVSDYKPTQLLLEEFCKINKDYLVKNEEYF